MFVNKENGLLQGVQDTGEMCPHQHILLAKQNLCSTSDPQDDKVFVILFIKIMTLWKNNDENLVQGPFSPLYCPISLFKDHLVNYLYFSVFHKEKNILHNVCSQYKK